MFKSVPTSPWKDKPELSSADPGDSPINIMVKQDKPFIIKMGTPLTQVIPFERKTTNCVTREPSNQGIYRFEAIRKSKFMTLKGWRDKVVSKHKDNFVVDAQNTDLPEN